MFESKVINDINGTYLIIISESSEVLEYELKMFENNKIRGFLPISVSRMNNSIQFHYKIMDYENLTRAFYSRTFDVESIKDIFQAITEAGRQAAEYLLDPDGILLNPEYIYVNKREFLFCYYPAGKQSFHKGVRELMEYMLERLEHSNQENVMLAYGLYQKILKNNFTMEMLMEEFFKDVSEGQTGKVITPDFTEVKKTEEIAESYAKGFVEQESKLDLIEEELLYMEPKKKKQKFSLSQLFDKKISFFSSKPSKKQNKPLVLAEKTTYGSTQLLTGKLLVSEGDGINIPLMSLPLEIGSSLIDNQAVSRRHAIITMECGNYYVEDQGSTNGTFVNGSRISSYEPIQIKEGDVITFANERYRLN